MHNEHFRFIRGLRNGILLSIPLWAIIIGLIFLLAGCSTTYNACKDPNSYITFMPQQCHGNYNRAPWDE